MLNLYITSPSKAEGKTFITAGLATVMQSLGYKTAVYKPIQLSGLENSGFMQSPDLTLVKKLDPYIDTHFTYLFKGQSDPLTASEAEDTIIDLDYIFKDAKKFAMTSDCIILDGEGGIMTPIAHELQNIDLINKLQTPVLFVVTLNENSINNILLSIHCAVANGISINGVVINNIKSEEENKKLTTLIRIIEEYSDAKVLGMLRHLGKNITPEELMTGVLNGIDIESVFNVKIAKLDF
ncbi:MAG: dethiobiotin synthase [bacterium]|nr:dethiobiotin synthase [bacterium]